MLERMKWVKRRCYTWGGGGGLAGRHSTIEDLVPSFIRLKEDVRLPEVDHHSHLYIDHKNYLSASAEGGRRANLQAKIAQVSIYIMHLWACVLLLYVLP